MMPQAEIAEPVRLFNLYKKKDNEEVFDFNMGNGFSIVQQYQNKKYSDYILLMRVEMDNQNFLNGDVSMTKPDMSDGVKAYKHLTVEELPSTVSNFSFSKEFIYKDGKFYHIRYPKKDLTMNEVVDNLVYNHLKGISRLRKIIHNYSLHILLFISYFMVDRFYSYDRATSEMIDRWIDLHHNTSKVHNIIVSNPEPFLKYFNIYKNQLLLFLVISGIVISKYLSCTFGHISISKFPDVTNLGVVILSFISLFFLEKTSLFFASLFSSTKEKNSTIENLINGINNFSFKLKIK